MHDQADHNDELLDAPALTSNNDLYLQFGAGIRNGRNALSRASSASDNSLPPPNLSVYDELIKNLPEFERYIYEDDESSIDDEPSTAQNHSSEKPTTSTSVHLKNPSVSFTITTKPFGSVAAERLLPSLQILRTIMEKRDQLYRRQLQIDSIERQLAEDRRRIEKEVKRATQVVSHPKPEIDFRFKWARSLARLDSYIKNMTGNEEKLDEEERELLRAQLELKTVVGELYASLTLGARIDESEASVDDSMARAIPPTSPQHLPHELTLRGPSVSASESASSTESVPMIEVSDDDPPDLRLDDPSLATDPVSQAAVNRAQTNKSTVPKPKRKPRHPELAFCGSNLPSQGLRDYIADAEHDEYLSADDTLRAIREKDLKPEIAIDGDLQRVASSNAFRKTFKQKFESFNVRSYHLNDFISSWGANMSQNAWIDLRRSIHYDRPIVSENREALSLSRLDVATMTEHLRELDIPSIPLKYRKTPSSVAVAITNFGNPDTHRDDNRSSPPRSSGKQFSTSIRKLLIVFLVSGTRRPQSPPRSHHDFPVESASPFKFASRRSGTRSPSEFPVESASQYKFSSSTDFLQVNGQPNLQHVHEKLRNTSTDSKTSPDGGQSTGSQLPLRSVRFESMDIFEGDQLVGSQLPNDAIHSEDKQVTEDYQKYVVEPHEAHEPDEPGGSATTKWSTTTSEADPSDTYELTENLKPDRDEASSVDHGSEELTGIQQRDFGESSNERAANNLESNGNTELDLTPTFNTSDDTSAGTKPDSLGGAADTLGADRLYLRVNASPSEFSLIDEPSTNSNETRHLTIIEQHDSEKVHELAAASSTSAYASSSSNAFSVKSLGSVSAADVTTSDEQKFDTETSNTSLDSKEAGTAGYLPNESKSNEHSEFVNGDHTKEPAFHNKDGTEIEPV